MSKQYTDIPVNVKLSVIPASLLFRHPFFRSYGPITPVEFFARLVEGMAERDGIPEPVGGDEVIILDAGQSALSVGFMSGLTGWSVRDIDDFLRALRDADFIEVLKGHEYGPDVRLIRFVKHKRYIGGKSDE
jgi:hypothetical protein